jgi:integrase
MRGSLGYQMMKALQGIFHPGANRHQAKKHHLDRELITSISTMRCMSADVHQFARFIRFNWPLCKNLDEVIPEMALAYIEELQQRERSGGRIARVCASIRKMDIGARRAGIFLADAPSLLPYKDEGGPGGFHSESRSKAYAPLEAQKIINWIQPKDPTIERLLTLMIATGLRVTEASYLRTQDIDLQVGAVLLNQEGNENRTKGGRPRQATFQSDYQEFMAGLKASCQDPLTQHMFQDRRSLPDRARDMVRQACQELNIPCLGTHGFRKSYAVATYHHSRAGGASDQQSLLETSHQLGHNRTDVTRQSYVSVEERVKEGQ